jgi:hypothetical protein
MTVTETDLGTFLKYINFNFRGYPRISLLELKGY